MNYWIKQIGYILLLMVYAAVRVPLVMANTIIGVIMFIGWFSMAALFEPQEQPTEIQKTISECVG